MMGMSRFAFRSPSHLIQQCYPANVDFGRFQSFALLLVKREILLLEGKRWSEHAF